MTTPKETKVKILADLWMDYRQEPEFEDFISYNDLGLPLAYIISEDIVKMTNKAETFINETFDLLLGGLDLEDTGFESLDDLLDGVGDITLTTDTDETP
jgi:hypothetical protein